MQETPVLFLGGEDLEKGQATHSVFLGFSGGSVGKESAWNVGHLGSIPRFGKSPGGGHGNPFQYPGLENLHGQRSLRGLQYIGPQRVGHYQVNFTSLYFTSSPNLHLQWKICISVWGIVSL